jgi:amino-acid N-acetyltransferase
MAASLERVTVEQIDAVLQLLRGQQLPTDGLRDHLSTTLVARDGDRIVGSAALEVYPHGALLRSVAVATEQQGQGLGRALTEAAIQLACEIQAPAIYLLTTTAEDYFPRFGFDQIERTAVPASVRTSIEFTFACPSSATVMRKSL